MLTLFAKKALLSSLLHIDERFHYCFVDANAIVGDVAVVAIFGSAAIAAAATTARC